MVSSESDQDSVIYDLEQEWKTKGALECVEILESHIVDSGHLSGYEALKWCVGVIKRRFDIS